MLGICMAVSPLGARILVSSNGLRDDKGKQKKPLLSHRKRTTTSDLTEVSQPRSHLGIQAV